jgi:D-alanyl-D-alanine carboxypeptidase (penicillin-binding protein 5/6)
MIAPISAGQKVGLVKFVFDGKTIASHPLVALETIDTANLFSQTWDGLRLLFN